MSRVRFYRRSGKQVLDLALVLLIAPLWLPVLGVATLLVRMTLGSPVFFWQRRPGLNGHAFAISKLRTMTDACNEEGQLLPDEERLTRIGCFLRRTSLDELPEFLNVLRGDMSLVGPRPLLMQYLGRYSPEQARRHEVKPGITGWAQVNGRNAITWAEKFSFDVWYVDNVSFWLDLRILGSTIWKVLRGEGLSAQDHATMPEFLGRSDE